MKITLSVIKADIGSIGGHIAPSRRLLETVRSHIAQHGNAFVIDSYVSHTGDDIAILLTHTLGPGDPQVHRLAWDAFTAGTRVAKEQGLYGAGQDLLKDAPSGNVRGAGPGAAEITFDETAKERPAEPFLVFTADKCGPGAFNFPLWAVFTSPLFNAGLMMPSMRPGFTFRVIDMEHAGADRVIELVAPEEHIDLAILLRDENRFGIQTIHSRKYPHQQVVAVSTDRLHTIAGEYKGKDDPVAIVRTQGIFPAPEEVVMPYVVAPYVAGDARGSHTMPLMPVAINTPVSGPYCLPIVACVAYSVNKEGRLAERMDMFGNPVWDHVRLMAQQKGIAIRQQGFVGAAMLPIQELEYSAFRHSLAELEKRFVVL